MQAGTDRCGLDVINDTRENGLYRGSPDQLVKHFHNLSSTISPWKLAHIAVQKEIKHPVLAYTRVFIYLSRMFRHGEKQIQSTDIILIYIIVFFVNIRFSY